MNKILRILDALVGLVGLGFGLYMLAMFTIDIVEYYHYWGQDLYYIKQYIILLVMILSVLYISGRMLYIAIIEMIAEYKGVE